MLTYKKILVPIDLHEGADCATLIDTAVSLARFCGAALAFMNAVDIDLDSPMLQSYDSVRNDFVKSARGLLRDVVDRHMPDDMSAEFLVLNGRSYSKVLEAAREVEADLIIVMAHKPGMKEYLLGMTAARVVRHAECSVLVVRD